MISFGRVIEVMRKELIQTRRDRRVLPLVILMPIIQLFLYGYAVSTSIKHLRVAVLDQSYSEASRRLVQVIGSSEYFDITRYTSSYDQVRLALDRGDVNLAVVIPPDFDRLLRNRQRVAQVQVLLDGSDPNTATVAQGYMLRIIQSEANRYLIQRLQDIGISTVQQPGVDARVRIWYNPSLESRWFMIPGVIALVLVVMTMNLTATAIVRERERGTIEQLIVTPIRPTELILGKTLPFVLIGYVQVTTVLTVGTLWFGVPLRGSLLLLLGLAGLFLLTTLGLGLLVSAVSKTQQQASMTVSFFMTPNFLLSGFFFPIANMPYAIQLLTYLVPLRYFLVIVRAIFLKGVGLGVLWPQVVPLAALAVIILALSVSQFHKKLE